MAAGRQMFLNGRSVCFSPKMLNKKPDPVDMIFSRNEGVLFVFSFVDGCPSLTEQRMRWIWLGVGGIWAVKTVNE